MKKMLFSGSLLLLLGLSGNWSEATEIELKEPYPPGYLEPITSSNKPLKSELNKRSTNVPLSKKEYDKINMILPTYHELFSQNTPITKFVDLPILSNGTYQLGTFTDEQLDNAEKQVNLYRQLAGLKEVPVKKESIDFTQHASIGMASKRKQTHNLNLLDKPSDMPIEFWNTATEASARSLIHSSFNEMGTSFHIDSYMTDYGSSNKSTGHRLFILGLPVENIGIGYAQAEGGILNTSNNYYNSVYTQNNYSTITQKYPSDTIISWPSETIFPNQLYNKLNPYSEKNEYTHLDKIEKNMRWSVSFNEKSYDLSDNVTVQLTNTETDESVKMLNDNNGGELSVVKATPGYYPVGGYNTVVFRPNNDWKKENNVVYDVKVTGILKEGKDYTHQYQTKFVDMTDTFELADTPVESIMIDKNQTELEVSNSLSLKTTITPENASNKQIQWSSSDSSIATVNSEGIVTGITAGTVLIKAMTESSNKTDTIELTIKEKETIPVLWYSVLTHTVRNVDVNEPVELSIIPYPINATNAEGTIVFLEDDAKEYGTIDQQNKTVTFSKKGQYYISYNANDGSSNANLYGQNSTFINVGTGYDGWLYLGPEIPKPRIRVTDFNIKEKSISLSVGESYQVATAFVPENSTEKTVDYRIDDETIAKVSYSGKVTGLKKGKTFLRGYSWDGGIESISEITVK